ncbi:helix-turn-helix transcriptional regulator [archaeon]|jgi:DNA-binding transcriptional ArsR family regulator|nr:helix-turn-helix transcriptional regulator [archaeon]MBT4272229.1 helix-turn-helix transcriptional regulator [archaeon]MBT4460618.1 helix-turn-helix transcriptional regulator [archaeon]MBT4857985.1 helix-turn-helix transcriptional regulator [archaeon]MBT5424168.1 helix-turn-helix transcriptional regulator [archaeon]
MADESFLMVSLDEDKSKKLAQVLSNDTSRKILDLLSKKDLMTETQIAKELNIPLSTAHYNLNLLVKSDLVNDDQFTYSKKGKKINHYSLSNKYVIIAPKKSSKIFDKLKDFLPIVLISGLASLVIKYFSEANLKISNIAAGRSTDLIQNEFAESMALDVATKSVEPTLSFVPNYDLALWFLAGSLFAILLSFIYTTWIKKK